RRTQSRTRRHSTAEGRACTCARGGWCGTRRTTGGTRGAHSAARRAARAAHGAANGAHGGYNVAAGAGSATLAAAGNTCTDQRGAGGRSLAARGGLRVATATARSAASAPVAVLEVPVECFARQLHGLLALVADQHGVATDLAERPQRDHHAAGDGDGKQCGQDKFHVGSP